MQSVIGALRVILGADTVAFEEGLTQAQKTLNRAGKQMQKTGEKLKGIGSTLSLAVTAPMAAFGVTAVQAATESKQAIAQVEAAVKSMGGASGKAVPELQAMAAQLQGLSTFDDDDILKNVTANLLTFGRVAGPEFERAQLAIVNLSTRLGVDLKSATLQVGKALNDPIAGIGALSRAGIQFTTDQKAMIRGMVETGNVAGAQKIILAELERQFGGAAKAARDAAPDQAMVDAWREFQETVGAALLKVLPQVTAALTGIMTAFAGLSPEMQQFLIGAAAIGTVLGPALLIVGQAITILGGLYTAFAAIGPAIAIAKTALVGLAIAGGPIFLTIAAIAAIGTACYVFRDEIGAAFTQAVEFAKQLYVGVKTWVSDKLNAVWDALQAKVQKVGDFFYKLWDRVVGHSYIPDMVDAIGEHMGRLDGLMVDPAREAAGAVASSFAGMANSVAGSIEGIAQSLKSGDWKGAASSALGALGQGGGKVGKWANLAKSVFDGLQGFKNGGSFTVGGRGGTDSNLVAFRATRGEQVSIARPGQGGGGGITIHQTIAPNFAGNAATREEVAMMGQIARQQAIAGVKDAMSRRGAWR